MIKNFNISDKEYQFYVKYLKLIKNEKLLQNANIRLNNYINNNSLSHSDFFLNNSIHYYFDIFFLDFLSKFIFRRSIVRLKLNMILALHEAEFYNFKKMINSSNFKMIILDFFKFVIILITCPIWLLCKFLIFKLKHKQ